MSHDWHAEINIRLRVYWYYMRKPFFSKRLAYKCCMNILIEIFNKKVLIVD